MAEYIDREALVKAIESDCLELIYYSNYRLLQLRRKSGRQPWVGLHLTPPKKQSDIRSFAACGGIRDDTVLQILHLLLHRKRKLL